MVLTSKEAKLAFTHILDNVIGRNDGTPLKSSLNEVGIDDIFGLTNLTGVAIDSLSFIDTNNNNAVTPIKSGDKMLLRSFLSYVGSRQLEGIPIGDDWSLVTQEDFDTFRIDPKNMSILNLKVLSSSPSNISSKPTNPTQYTPFTTLDCNLCAELVDGETFSETSTKVDHIIKSRDDMTEGAKQISTQSENLENPQASNGVVFNSVDLVGKTFQMDTEEDVVQAQIVKLLQIYEGKIEDNPSCLKFLLSVNNEKAEEVITNSKLLEYLVKHEQSDVVWKFKYIVCHEGPLKPGKSEFKHSPYHRMIEWEPGEITTEPLQLIASDDPVTWELYAKEKNFLDWLGRKRFKKITKWEKLSNCMVNHAKRCSFNTSTKYKCGYEIRQNYNHGLQLDEKNGNNLWKYAAELELQQITEYQKFEDKVHHTKVNPIQLIFSVNSGGIHRIGQG
jgi:hypothetical protein